MFTAPQKRLLNESNDLALLQQQEQSLRKNLVKIPDANSHGYRQVYAQWKTVSDKIKALQQPLQKTGAESPEERYDRVGRKEALQQDFGAIERMKKANPPQL